MPYGYYSDPGNTYGNTGQTNQNETFIQRQQRLQQRQQQPGQPPADGSGAASQSQAALNQWRQKSGAPATPPPGSTGTPVSGNGGIPAPQPAAPPAPAPPPPPAAPAVSASADFTPQQAVAAGLNWVPKDHPMYGKPGFVGSMPAGAASAAPAAPAGPTPGTAAGGPAEAAKSGMFTQYAAPDHDFQNWQQLQLVSNLLANPDTMGPDVLNKMKQKSMEEALQFQQQQNAQDDEELAARGFTAPGGLADARRRKTSEAVQNAILGQNRDFEVQASQQNRDDRLKALGTAEAILGGQVGRGSQVYDDVLKGQQANRGDYYQGKQLDLQKELGVGGLNIDQQRVNSSNKQFDASHGLDILKFLEGQREFNGQNGLGWAQLNQNGQNATMDRITNILNGRG